MSSYDKSRKAAGSSSDQPLRQNQRKSSSASQPKYKYERPPTSPYNNTADSLSYVPPLRSSHQSQGPSTSTRRMSSQHQVRPQYHEAQVSDDDMSFRSARDAQSSKKNSTTSVLLNDDDDDQDEEDSDDSWDMLEREAPNHKTPTSYFPGTWPTALHDTSVAAKHVGAATYSYATALTQSGIGQAGWSIGSALAASGKRGAKRVAGWWNRGDGVQEGGIRGRDEEMWGDERGLYVLEQKEMDGTGEIVGERRRVHRGVEEDGFRKEEMMGTGGAVEEVDEDEEEAEEGEDGLMRLFQYDD